MSDNKRNKNLASTPLVCKADFRVTVRVGVRGNTFSVKRIFEQVRWSFESRNKEFRHDHFDYFQGMLSSWEWGVLYWK